MKKILLTESEKKAIILEREQAIVKSFAKTFNTIKRIDENELTEERPISARYGADPTPEQSAGIDKFVKGFLDKKYYVTYYNRFDQEMHSEEAESFEEAQQRADLSKTVVGAEGGDYAVVIDSKGNKIYSNKKSGNELSEIGSMSNYEGNRGDDYKYDGSGDNEWVPFYDDIKAEGWSWDDESSTIGTKCCEYTVEFYRDNQYGLYRDNQYGHGHRGERLTKTALNIDELISLIHNIESANQLGENDGEDYEAASRGVEYGINPYQEQPVMDEKANSIDTITKALVDGGFFGPTDIKNGEMLNSFSKNKLVHNEHIRNAITKIGKENNLPYEIVDVYWHKFW